MSPWTTSTDASSSAVMIWASRRVSVPRSNAVTDAPSRTSVADRPGADAAHRAGDEEPLRRPAHETAAAPAPASAADAAPTSCRHGFGSCPMPSIDTVDHVAVREQHRRVAEDPDAARRPGRDDVAGLEGERHRAVADDRRDAEEHLAPCSRAAGPRRSRGTRSRAPAGRGISSAVTSAGPIGQNVSSDLPRIHWPSPNWRSRAETSSRQV